MHLLEVHAVTIHDPYIRVSHPLLGLVIVSLTPWAQTGNHAAAPDDRTIQPAH